MVIHRHDTPRLTFETGPSVTAFLAEGVFAAIEVKSELTSAKLREAIETLRKVRDTCLPVPVGMAIGPYIDRPLRVIFAYEGATYDTMLTELSKSENADIVDFVCVLARGGWVRTEIGSRVGMIAGPGTPLPFIGLWKSGPTLAMLYYFLNQFAGSFMARAIPLGPYFTPIEGWGD